MTRRLLHGLGEVLVTLGLVVLLYAAYEFWFTGLQTARAQADLRATVERAWAEAAPEPTPAPTGEPGRPAPEPPPYVPGPPPEAPPVGEPMAILRIPRFGADYAPVVVEGVGREELKTGPGHYPGTAMPGQVGNFVVSGHRTTYGAPFNRLDEVVPGDAVVVRDADEWFVYRITDREVVPPTATEVIAPVPNEPGAEPERALLTLTTCHPEFSARERLIVYGELERVAPVAGGEPPELTEAR